MRTFLTAILTCIALSTFSTKAQKNVKTDMFPEAQPGYQRVIITLPEKKNEDNFKVEIFAGKTVETDNCNKYFMTGKITEETLHGWGYSYYNAETNGGTAGTMMMCPDGKKVLKFVHMPTLTVRYNSKLPVVIYAPEGIEIKYKIWSAGKFVKQ